MEQSKVLAVLLGSPRVGGNTEVLAKSFAAGAEEAGYEVKTLRLAPLALKGCLDCRRCWSTGKPCIQNDDMIKVHELLQEASAVAVVSPLYYYTFSSQIKPVFDRTLPFGAANSPVSIKGKKCVLLAAAGDETDDVFDGMIATYKHICNFLKWENAGMICAPGIYVKGDMEKLGQQWLEKARELGKTL